MKVPGECVPYVYRCPCCAYWHEKVMASIEVPVCCPRCETPLMVRMRNPDELLLEVSLAPSDADGSAVEMY